MIKKKKQEIEQGARDITDIKDQSERGWKGARGSGREREEARGNEREWEGVGVSGRDDKQRRLLKQKVVLDTHLPLTRCGKYIIKATHLFPYPWSFQVLTVLADVESGVKQWSICDWRRRGSLSMGKACLGCGDRYKLEWVRLIYSEDRSSEVAVRCLSSWKGEVFTSNCPCDCSVHLLLTCWLDRFGYKVGYSFRVNPWTAHPSYTQIGQVVLAFFLA